MKENSLIKAIPQELLVDELRVYDDWGCIKPLEDQSKSCPHRIKEFEQWCPSCRAWGLLAYHEKKLPTQEYRRMVSTYLVKWKRQAP